jgi:prophage antirepressor-like protein
MSTAIELFTYTGHELRAVIIDGDPWFVSAGALALLDLNRSSIACLDDDERAVHTVDTPGGPQQVSIISESGLYSLILRSRKPEAKAIKRWITGEVLPSIRRTGQYGVPELDLSDPIAAIEAVREREGRALDIARAERVRADKAERRVEIEQRHRRAIEGGDGILLTDFGKKYFSEVRHTDFFEHLYTKKWLIDQRGTRVRADGEVRDGHDHRKPTYKGRPFIYEHDTGVHGGQRRFQPRVRPQKEIELRDALAAEGLPVNMHSTGLVLITNDELKGLGA